MLLYFTNKAMQAPPLRLYPHSTAKLKINFYTTKKIVIFFKKEVFYVLPLTSHSIWLQVP